MRAMFAGVAGGIASVLAARVMSLSCVRVTAVTDWVMVWATADMAGTGDTDTARVMGATTADTAMAMAGMEMVIIPGTERGTGMRTADIRDMGPRKGRIRRASMISLKRR